MDQKTLDESYVLVRRYVSLIKVGCVSSGRRRPIGMARLSRLDDYPATLGMYGDVVYKEMVSRGLNPHPIGIPAGEPRRILLRRGQLELEWGLLRLKAGRLNFRWAPGGMMFRSDPEPNPVFALVDGDVEPWEPTLADRERMDEIHNLKLWKGEDL